MDNYIDISLDLGEAFSKQVDVRIPQGLLVKDMLQLVSDAYGLQLVLENPMLRIVQTGQLLLGTNSLLSLKNGMLVRLERV